MGETLGTYNFPSRSAVENYDGDMIVHIWIKGRSLLPCAAAVRVPQTMPWSEFHETQVKPLIDADAFFDHSKTISWELVGEPFTPEDGKSLVDNGISHKNPVSIVTA